MFGRIFRAVLLTSAFISCGLLALYLDGRWLPVSAVPVPVVSLLAQLGLWPGSLASRPVKGETVAQPLAAPDVHGQSFSCTTGATGIVEKPKQVVYQWRDGEGHIHFGDTPPENRAFREMDVGSPGKDYFALTVSYPAGPVPADVRTAVVVGGNAIYRVYADMLSLAAMSKANIDVKVFGHEGAYQQYRNRLAPNLPATTDGFYSWERNEAAVLHRGSPMVTRRTALHEAAHVINARNFGVMPKWFNEGTAEYFENAVVRGQMISIEYSREWLAGLGNAYRLLPLSRLLSATDVDWSGAERNTFYANSWALVYFLMLPENRALMADFQRRLADNKCVGIDSVAFWESRYSGGVAQLERNWRRWLKGNLAVPTTF